MKIQVRLLGGLTKVVDIDPRATWGATVGVNVWNQDGTLWVPPTGGNGQMQVTDWTLITSIPPNVKALAETATVGLYTITGAGASATRTIQPVVGETTVGNGSGVSGDPVVGLADVTPTTGGTIQRLAFDAKGRRSQADTATTDNLPEGATNLYFTMQRVRDTVLTGISFASSAVITAADTVLSALGKLQAQVSGKEPAIAAGTTAQFWRGDKAFSDTLLGNLLRLSGTDATEVSLDIGNDGGGTAVLHYRFKNPVGGFPGSGQLLGGAGSRPWTGSGFSSHSTAAYHLLATETHTASAQGSDFAILATPIGGTQANRIYVAYFNGDGDIINSNGVLQRKFNSLERGRGIEVARNGAVAEQSLVSNQAGLSTGYRGYAISGTLTSPGATQANAGTFFGLCGHDSSAIVGAKALVGLTAFATWTASSTPTYFYVETTPTGSTTRQVRLLVGQDGTVRPGADNTQPLGFSSYRWTVVYAATGTINTSDAREKTAVTPLSVDEISAAKAMAREIGTFRWLEAVERKGGDARLHIGLTVQRAMEIMRRHELDPFRYGFICYDEWSEQPEVIGEDGVVVSPAREAGSRYSFRMDELNLFMARAFEARLEALERSVGK